MIVCLFQPAQRSLVFTHADSNQGFVHRRYVSGPRCLLQLVEHPLGIDPLACPAVRVAERGDDLQIVVAIPPRPSGARISYRPNRVPAASIGDGFRRRETR